MKKTILSLAIVILSITLPVNSFATPDSAVLQSVQAMNSSDETIFIENNSTTPPSVPHSDAALLVDMNSGRLLYGKNIDKRVFPASTTKIMTGILAIEMGNWDEIVSASAEALAPITSDDSQIGLHIGEKLSLEQLVNAMLIPSANDAANVIAVHLAGSIDAFVELMNQKAQQLGMNNTHFVNTCGMHHKNHYTTARDLSILAQYAMKNETFRKIVKTSVYKLPPTNKCTTERVLYSTNLFLSSIFHRNPLCTGIKTGRTSKAGYCLVSSAQHQGMYLLSVVMGCDNADTEANAYSYTHSKALFDFGFNNYMNKTIAAPGDIVHTSKVYEAKGRIPVELTIDNTINALVPSVGDSDEIETKFELPEQIPAPITKGTILGTVTYSYKGTLIGTAHLVAANDVERNEFLYIIHKIGKIISSPFFFVPAIIILLIISNHNRKKRIRKRRMQRQRLREAQQNKQADFIR